MQKSVGLVTAVARPLFSLMLIEISILSRLWNDGRARVEERKNNNRESFMMILQPVDGLCIDMKGNTINLGNQDCHWATYISRYTSVPALRIGPNVP